MAYRLPCRAVAASILKSLTEERIRASYRSCVRHSDKGYAATLKTKIDLTDSKHTLHCWDADGNLVEAPESWRSCDLNPKLHVSHLWFMDRSFGPVIRLTDAQVLPPPDTASAERKSPI